MMSIQKAMLDLVPEFTAIRQHLHQYPELSHKEFQTSEFIASCLNSWGIEVHTDIASTGVVGVLRNGDGTKSIALRADMDALAIVEKNLFEHASKNEGVMHACGHDGHMAMLLMTARYLAQSRQFSGTVYFVFQPSEEQDGGASEMVQAGLFEKFPSDMILGCHNWPELPVGTVGVADKAIMASCNAFEIEVTGRGSHGAMPNLSVDPIFVSIQIANALQGIITRMKKPQDAAVLSICQVKAGQSYNVIPDSAYMGGTVRTFDESVTDLIESQMKSIATQVAIAFGAQAKVTFDRQVSPVINTPDCAQLVKTAVIETLGVKALVEQEPVMPSEDFGEYLKKVPGAFFFVGSGANATPGLHNPQFDFNDEALPIGASVFVQVVENYLHE